MSHLEPVKSYGSALHSITTAGGNILEQFAAEDGGEQFRHVTFREYLREAEIQREYEKSEHWGEPAPTVPWFSVFKSKKSEKPTSPESSDMEKSSVYERKDLISEPLYKSLENANRMLRVASWGSIFFLITTDILGPTAAPYSVLQLGYVPGALLYFLFGIAAAYTGYLLSRIFLSLDSVKYPLHNYGDLVGRVCGSKVRYGVSVLQVIQLICNVAVIILGNGNGLSQIAKGRSCYTFLVFVWSLAGMIVGQIRSLQRFGFLANLAIWMNVFVIIMTMVVTTHSPPNYVGAEASNSVPFGPIDVKVVVSGAGKTAFTAQLNACMNIVYAYGGAMLFVEFMSEMKRPRDFWKGMAFAQVFIFSVYMIYGLYVYSRQGQFAMNPANQGISIYSWQTVGNVVNLVSALIAAGLYGNVGIKVFYGVFLQRIFRLPDLTSKYGRYIWTGTVILYWGIAYVIAAAIPQFSALTGLIGAVCILQFSYTFPPIVMLTFDMRVGAIKYEDENGLEPDDSNKKWLKLSTWVHAYKYNWMLNTFHFFFFLAALATAALGIYASLEMLKDAYQSKLIAPFSCKSTVA